MLKLKEKQIAIDLVWEVFRLLRKKKLGTTYKLESYVNSILKVLRHASESLSKDLLDFLHNLSFGGSRGGVSEWWEERRSYLEALVD